MKELDLNRLHEVFFDSERRHSGKATLFIYEMIGVAQTNAYSWDKIEAPIAIYCSSPLRWAMECIDRLEEVCRLETVKFLRKDRFTFVIENTAFVLCQSVSSDYYLYTWEGSDLDLDNIEISKEYAEKITLANMAACFNFNWT